ncbi:chemotaxis protein CheW [Oceanicoccus sagamiensis]|uniref:Chemotaxis protein CheW n=1 Tax=Oceanicoccus sagamiensis TaxID=716816 RepID=A0A1X9N954_9GAMM|nr:chemotaxis protein CheW [Oceanicoccus sagamiensis]ARN73711.1 chemotaxis protein CheW [Oceanicoccus sagamiensis]
MSGELQSTIAANELATLLIPMSGKQLVLPNVSVAEIIPYIEPQADDDKPDWYLGAFNWRNTDVPLVSFEAMNGESSGGQGKDRRIAVLNGLVDNQRLPFCGIVTEGVPRLMRIMPDEVSADEGATKGPSELSSVMVSGEKAVIPDVDFIQQEVLNVL